MPLRRCLVASVALAFACGDDTPTPGAGTTTDVSTTSSNGSDGSDAADETESGSTGAPEALGCNGTALRKNPDDPSRVGPWPVGVGTFEIDGITTEVWYPARPGTEAGQDSARYDIRLSLPEAEQGKISDADNPWQPCACYRDLPIDADNGPYPAVFFIHGTAGFRTQSLPQMTHWASRGFIVIAMDHPGLSLADLLGAICGGPTIGQVVTTNVRAAMAAARGQTPELAGIAEHVDAARFAVSGHSAGGAQTARLGDDAQVLIPMAAGGVEDGSALQSTLVLGALLDSVVEYPGTVSGYESSPAPKRLVGIDNQGHLAFSSLCSLRNAAGDDLLTIAAANDVCGVEFAGNLFQCDDAFLPDPDTWEIVNFATSAVLEETLHCSDIGAQLEGIMAAYPGVAEYRADL